MEVTRQYVADLMDQVFEQCRATREAGQREYAHSQQNALRNFEQTGAELEIPREKVWYIFAKKHWDGILAWIRGHKSQREDVRGRIKDLIVYLVLLWAMADAAETTSEANDGESKALREQGACPRTEIQGQGNEGPQGR